MEYIKFKNFIERAQYGYTAEFTSPNGNKKYLRITDIVPYFVDKNRVPLVEIDEKKAKNYLVKENDLLIARTGATTGYNLVVPSGFDDYIFASYLVRYFYDKNKLFPGYLKHVLKSQQWYGFINNYIGGSAQPGMNPRTIGKFQFPYQDYGLQKKIATILNNYDLLIENNNERIRLLEDAAESIYKEWFVRFRYPHATANTKIACAKGWTFGNRENGQTIPFLWDFKELKNLAEFKRGKNITAANMVEGPIPVISAGLEPSGYHNKSNVVGPNLTISASGANAGYLSYHLRDVWAADCSFYCDASNIWFIYCALNFLRPVLDNMQVGSAQPHVYPKNINRLSTIIPTDDLINMFMKKVTPLFEKIKDLERETELLVQQRDALLPRLMSGKLAVKGKEFI